MDKQISAEERTMIIQKQAICYHRTILHEHDEYTDGSIVNGYFCQECRFEFIPKGESEYRRGLREAVKAVCPACRGVKKETHKCEVFHQAAVLDYWHSGTENKYPPYRCRASKIREALLEAK